jgi:hypothetical protein
VNFCVFTARCLKWSYSEIVLYVQDDIKDMWKHLLNANYARDLWWTQKWIAKMIFQNKTSCLQLSAQLQSHLSQAQRLQWLIETKYESAAMLAPCGMTLAAHFTLRVGTCIAAQLCLCLICSASSLPQMLIWRALYKSEASKEAEPVQYKCI